MMLLDMIVITLVCWALLGLITYGRNKVLSMIPLFRDNKFDESEFRRHETMYTVLKIRTETTEDFSYKRLIALVLLALIPIFNFFFVIFLTGWLFVLLITDLGLAARYGLQKFDFWDRNI